MPVENYNHIPVYEGMAGMRTRLSMYLGGTSNAEDGTAPQALYQMYQESITNSLDEAVTGFGREIRVVIHSDNSISCADAGRGIPNGDDALNDAINSFTKLHSSSKIEDNGYLRIGVGGTHGVGNTAINAGSAWMKVRVSRSDIKYELDFEKGVLKRAQIVDSLEDPWFDTHETGTLVHYLPDTSAISDKISKPVLESNDWDFDELLERGRVSAMLCPQVRVDLIDLRGSEPREISMIYPNGLVSRMQELGHDEQSVISTSAEAVVDGYTFRARFALTSGSGNIFSYANGVPTRAGGYHEDGFRESITKAVGEYLVEKKLYKGDVGDIKRSDVIDSIDALIAIDVDAEILEFPGQTKDRLGTVRASKAVKDMVSSYVADALFDNAKASNLLAETVLESKADREASVRARETEQKKRQASKNTGLTVSADLKKAKSKKVEERELYLVEGKSASNIGRDANTQAVFPLRGVPKNVFEIPLAKALDNKEVATIVSELGAGVGKSFDIAKVRYGKIILVPDADFDGDHILALLIALFSKLFPGMIESGKIYYVEAPLYKAVRYVKGKQEARMFYSVEELGAVRDELEAHGWVATRFKGLGEMMPEDAHIALANPETRRLNRLGTRHVQSSLNTLKMLFGKDGTLRKKWLIDEVGAEFWSDNDNQQNIKNLLEGGDDWVEVESFTRSLMANFASYVVLHRMIPDVRDGLKPVQRRSEFQLHESKLNSRAKHSKLAKVSGAVSGNYHPHGSTAVSDAMVLMSQPWYKRLPLVDISGNNGTVEGDRAGADRYIEARQTLAGELLCSGLHQNAVDYQDNYDNTEKEPVVLPASHPSALINGSDGTGFAIKSTSLPHNPIEVMELVRLAHYGELTVENAQKVYRGIDLPTGNEVISSNIYDELTSAQASYTVRVRYHIEKSAIVITEAMYGKTTSELITSIANACDSISEVSDIFDEVRAFPEVKITISFKRGVSEKRIREIALYLEHKTLMTQNLHINNLFLADSRPQYLTVLEHVQHFATFRRQTLQRIWEFEMTKAQRSKKLRESELKIILDIASFKDLLEQAGSKSELREMVMDRFDLDEEQGEYIVSLPVHRLLKKDAERISSLHEAIAQQDEIISQRQHFLGEGLLESLSADVDKTISALKSTGLCERRTTEGEYRKPVKLSTVKEKVPSLARIVAVSLNSPTVLCQTTNFEPDDSYAWISTRTDRFVGLVMANGSMIVRRVNDLSTEIRINREMEGIDSSDRFVGVFEFDEHSALVVLSKYGYCKHIPHSKIMPATGTKRYMNTLHAVSGLKVEGDEIVFVHSTKNVTDETFRVTVDSKTRPQQYIDSDKLALRSDSGKSSGARFVKVKDGIEKITHVEVKHKIQEVNNVFNETESSSQE